MEHSGASSIEEMLGIINTSGAGGSPLCHPSDATGGQQQQQVANIDTSQVGGPPPPDQSGGQHQVQQVGNDQLVIDTSQVDGPPPSDQSGEPQLLAIGDSRQVVIADGKGGVMTFIIQDAASTKNVTVEYDYTPQTPGPVRTVRFQSSGIGGDKTAIIADFRRQLFEDNIDYGNEQLYDVILLTDTRLEVRGQEQYRQMAIDNQYVVKDKEYLSAKFQKKTIHRYMNGIVMLIIEIVKLHISINSFTSICICGIQG
jgi:hypothetical protein